MKKIAAATLAFAMLIALGACGETGKEEAVSAKGSLDPSQISSRLQYDHSMKLSYAREFHVDYYKGGYALISISDNSQFLLIPQGKEVPADLAESIVPLRQPIENTYLVASAAMDMYASIDAMDSIGFSALKQEDWYVKEAVDAMAEGKILYAGKYSAPDYELILAKGCGLAVENTMIFHSPKVKEQLEKFDIPVLVDHSSYEKTPQGRMEWVKLYGVLTGKEEKAEEVFEAQESAIQRISRKKQGNRSVAFFYISSNGGVNVRKSSDYLPKMIQLAGGKYVFEDLGDKDNMASSTMTMQMEDFYAAAKDADYLIYNSSIEGELSSLEDFLEESPLLEKFQAVKEGHVYCTTQNLYQDSMELGTMILDIYYMMAGKEQNLTYLYRLE